MPFVFVCKKCGKYGEPGYLCYKIARAEATETTRLGEAKL